MKKIIDLDYDSFLAFLIAIPLVACTNGITTGVPALLLLLVPKLILLVPYFI